MLRVQSGDQSYLFTKKTNPLNTDLVEDCVVKSTNDIEIVLYVISNTVFNIDLTTKFILDVNPLLAGILVEKIDEYISGINTFPKIWENLCKSKDYNLELYMNRTFPYYKIESKEWVELNIAVRKETNKESVHYDFLESNTSAKKDDDFKTEANVAVRDNNFLSLSLLPLDKYPDLNLIFTRINTLFELKLFRCAARVLLYHTISPRECHIIYDARYHAARRALKIDDDLIAYALFYALYILRQEETIIFSKVILQHRFVATLDNICEMPTFSYINLDRDPYIIQITGDKRLGDMIPMHLRGARCINSRAEFDRRFRLATSGAFVGVDLRALNASITGSILIPCVHKSPLEDTFKNVNWNYNRGHKIQTVMPELQNYRFMVDNPTCTEDIDFLNYVEYFYPSYVSLIDDDFQEQVLKVKDSSKPIDNSTTCIGYNQLADVDISITSETHKDFKIKAYLLYDQIKKNVSHRGNVHILEIKTKASTKYKIYGPGINRPMDIFRIVYEPIKMVKKFHVPCVRMYYDGDIYILRACASALLSGVGDSYKWFSCNKICVDVILKYIQRGISIVLNQLEKKILIEYIKSTPRWNATFQMHNLDPAKSFGTITQYHPFFYPGITNSGVRESLRVFERTEYARDICANVLVNEFPNDKKTYGSVQTHTDSEITLPSLTVIDAAIKSHKFQS